MPDLIAAAIATAFRDAANKWKATDFDAVLYRDLDRNRVVRVSTLALDEAARYDQEANRG